MKFNFAPTALLALILTATATAAGPAPVKLKLTVNDPLIPSLAVGLGAFAREGLDVEFVKVEDYSPHDYLMQRPLHEGRIDASYHWFQHVAFGRRHHLPLRAVMMVNDAPGMQVLVANRVKNQIRSGADFRGRRIAEGAGYATKSVLVNAIARRGGVPPGGYDSVLKEVEGREEAVLKALREGRVDVMAFMEPLNSAIKATGEVTVLYDLANREGTIAALGDIWPAHTVFLSEKFIRENPDTVQRLVNAFVRTMRFVNAHGAEEIAARLPDSYYTKRDRAKEVVRIRALLPGFARGDYSLTPSSAALLLRTVEQSAFDESEEGVWRRTAENPAVSADDLFDNRFVARAMKEIP